MCEKPYIKGFSVSRPDSVGEKSLNYHMENKKYIYIRIFAGNLQNHVRLITGSMICTALD